MTEQEAREYERSNMAEDLTDSIANMHADAVAKSQTTDMTEMVFQKGRASAFLEIIAMLAREINDDEE